MTHLDVKHPGTSVTPSPTTLSPQARQAIGIGALVLCLLIGGGLVYWFMFGAMPSRGEVSIDPNAPNRMRDRPGQPAPRILKINDTSWSVNGDAAVMIVSKAGGEYRFNYGFQRGALGVDQQQRALVAGRYRIIQDPAMAKAWKVTPEQVAKLKKIDIGSGGGMLKPSPEDRDQIKQMWDDYQNASEKSGPQQALLAKLDGVARANLDATRKMVLDRVDQIRQVLTPEQIAKITK